MKRILPLLLLLVASSQAFAQLPWSQRMANSVMKTSPTKYGYTWDYVTGTVLSGFQELYYQTGNTAYLTYIQSTVKSDMNAFTTSTKTLDNVKEGTALLFMYNNPANATDKTAYKNKAISVLSLLGSTSGISRTSEGGLWHKDPSYAWQMWGDGLYMAQPFFAQYSVLFNNSASEDFDDIALQFSLFETHARDAATGLLYHGWSEQPLDSRSTSWANPNTGLSTSFWGRAMGWYIMGLVDALDYFPKDHEKYPEMVAILGRLIPALAAQQHSSGCWYDVVDQGTRCNTANTQCNYLESSATSMYAYSILKACRLGYVDSATYISIGKKAYEGILTEFIETKGDTVIIKNNCKVSGLGGNGNRSGSFDYYMSEPIVTSLEDGKPIGPFILASLEYEALQATTELKPVITTTYKLNVSPNPVQQDMTVETNFPTSGDAYLAIINQNGKVITKLYEGKVDGGAFKEKYNLPRLPAGMYFVHCILNEQETIQKIVVR
jgi:unsaturated rhamnogalacturonyl hydrolase